MVDLFMIDITPFLLRYMRYSFCWRPTRNKSPKRIS